MRRIAAFALLLSLLLGGAHAAIPVRMDDAAALLTEDGSVILPIGTYEDIIALGGGLFAAATGEGLYALMDAEGALLTDAVYDEFRMEGNFLLARKDGSWGLMGQDGAEIGAFAYSRIETDGADGCWGIDGDSALFLLNADGTARDSGLRVLRIGEAAEGMLPVELSAGLWGCCDASGNSMISAEYEYVGSFVGGRAAAVSGGLYGAIDPAGAWIVVPEYDFLEISAAGFMLVSNEDGAKVLDMDGCERAVYSGGNVYAALAGAGYIVGDGEALRIYDATGSLLHEAVPDAAVSEGMGEQLVLSEGMWGEKCVRLMGTQSTYQNLYPLGTAGGEAVYACMEVNAARYENDLLHEIQISVDMDTARYGIVNAAGEQILPCDYVSIDFLADDRFLVSNENRWQMIDSKGKIFWSRRITQTEAPSS